MDQDLKLAIEMVTLIIVSEGRYPSLDDIEAASRRVLVSGLVTGLAGQLAALTTAISVRYPYDTERIGQLLVVR